MTVTEAEIEALIEAALAYDRSKASTLALAGIRNRLIRDLHHRYRRDRGDGLTASQIGRHIGMTRGMVHRISEPPPAARDSRAGLRA